MGTIECDRRTICRDYLNRCIGRGNIVDAKSVRPFAALFFASLWVFLFFATAPYQAQARGGKYQSIYTPTPLAGTIEQPFGTEYPTVMPENTAIPVCTRPPSTQAPTVTSFWVVTPQATCRPGFCSPGTNEPTPTLLPCPTNHVGTGTPGGCQPTQTATPTPTPTRTPTPTPTPQGLQCSVSQPGGGSCVRQPDGSLFYTASNVACAIGNIAVAYARPGNAISPGVIYMGGTYVQTEYSGYAANKAITQMRYQKFSSAGTSGGVLNGSTGTVAIVSGSGNISEPDSWNVNSVASVIVNVGSDYPLTGCTINGSFFISLSPSILTGTPTSIVILTPTPSPTPTSTPPGSGCALPTGEPDEIAPLVVVSDAGCFDLTKDLLIELPWIPSIGGLEMPSIFGVPRTTICVRNVVFNMSIFGIDIYGLLSMGISLWSIIMLWKEFRQ